MTIENRCVEIKATLQKLTDVKNPTARLVAVLMACGVTATSELAELVGVGERAVQKARKLLPQANQDSRTTVRNEPQFANHSSPPEPQFAENEPEFAPSRTHARAQMESPSGIVVTKEASKSREEVAEIEGLNGSTYRYVDMLAGWLAGDLRPKEPEVAHAILAGNVEHYGPDKVKAGMLELQAAIGAGQKPRDPGKAFSGFVKNAKPPKAGEPPRLSKADEKKAGALKLLESIRARAAAEAAA